MMRKIVAFLCAGLALVGCSRHWDDLAHEEVVAEITAFAVEGQTSCTINKGKKTIDVVMPAETDLSALTVTAFSLSEASATCAPFIQVGSVLNLSTPLTVTLTTYDQYTWVISASKAEAKPDEPDKPDQPENPDQPDQPEEPKLKEGPQLYNMGFDYWSVVKDPKLGVNYDAMYDENATDAQKLVWGSAAASTKMLSYTTVCPETSFVAEAGEGKKALKLQTCGIDALFGLVKKLAAGSAFTGYAGDIDIAKMSASIFWGTPFTERPKVLEGYYCYKPGTIDWSQEPYKSKEGEVDTGHVFVVLSDWEEPFKVSPPDLLLDTEKDPGIIGYGRITFNKEMAAYEKFSIEIEYRNERTPKYVTIVASSSALGDYFTGANGSVLYLDELKFWY